ncbi:MAG TPA: hypothetical protein PLQ88_13160, partial [Blastocatellia bacterium]|nr:hypothetical protein [Blastocatellia bacterium]
IQPNFMLRSLLLGICLFVTAMAQDAATSQSTCNSLPGAVQIVFDHVETLAIVNGKPINTYWLRIRNNSQCGIEINVPTEFISKTFVSPRVARDNNGQFIKTANGGFQIEYEPKIEFKDGDKVKAIYHLTNSRLKSVGAGNYEGCLVQSIVLQPGQTFLFPVTSPMFKKNHNVEVMFGYVGEKPISHEPLLRHRAPFAFNDIPQDTIKPNK